MAPISDVVFSQGSPVAPGESLSREHVQQLADGVLKSLGLGAVVRIEVERSLADFGIEAAPDFVATGFSRDGQVGLVAENLADDLDVFRTVFHELFHLGLSKTLPQGQYIQRMLGLLLDPTVRKYSVRWRNSADGVNRKSTMPVNNWMALSVEEALADIAEDLNTGAGGLGAKEMATWVRNMIRWFAGVLNKAGFDQVARQIQALSHSKAEKFVQATIRSANSSGPVQLAGKRFRPGTSTFDPASPDIRFSRASQTDTPAFKAWFGDSKVVAADGKPLLVYHGTAQGGLTEFDRRSWKTAYGHFFTDDKEAADYYAQGKQAETLATYLRAENPLRLDKLAEDEGRASPELTEWINDEFDPDYGDPMEQFNNWLQGGDLYSRGDGRAQDDLISWAEEHGHDGVVFYDAKGMGGIAKSYVVFDPAQIKSATGNNGDFDPSNPDIRYSKSTRSAPGLAPAQVQAIADRIKASWTNAPEIVVAANMQDPAIPQSARDEEQKQRSLGAAGSAEGFFYEGKVYLLADSLTSPSNVVEVLLHESVGHYGMRGAFGGALTPILQQLATMRKAEVTAKAKQYGLDMNVAEDRLTAAEEVLAEMAQTQPNSSFVQRAIAAIRTWLRKHMPMMSALKLTDDEIIANVLIPARQFVERGNRAQGRGQASFSRAAASQTDTPAFKVWYGDWQNAGGGNANAARGYDAPGRAEDVNAVQRRGDVDANNPGPVKVGKVIFTGASGPVGETGRPTRFYHGTRDSFAAFDTDHKNRLDKGWLGRGVYATSSSDLADSHAEWVKRPGNAESNTMPLYLAVRNPYVATNELKKRLKNASQATIDQFTDDLKAKGHDGVVMAFDDGHVELMAFDSKNVKSAIGNVGAFGQRPITAQEAKNAGMTEAQANQAQAAGDIRFSRSSAPMFSRTPADASPRATLGAYTKVAADKLNETFSHPGKLSLWDKTVGSMYHLAERSPPFKRVFTAAQDFINDVSFYANEAANLAPKILPRMESWRDLAKSPVSSADNKAIAAPLLEGTLSWTRDESGKPVRMNDLEASHAQLDDEAKAQMLLKRRLVTEGQLKRWKGSPLDIYAGAVRNRFAAAFQVPGVVWTDAELAGMFKLNPAQIGLYREFRAATDKSLDNLAKADLLRFGGKDVEAVRDLVMEAKDADEAAVLLRDYLLSMAGADLERADTLTDSANGMIDRADKVNKLKARGYTPLSRFGKYTVDVVVDGERQYFSLFETMADANKMAAQLREEFGQDNVEQGTLSQTEFEQFQGITPESLELFGNMLGLNSTGDEAKDKAFQAYIKLTKANRSAMKRMIHRKGTDGYSDEMGRVLAAFVYSNARQTSAALHMGELGEAVNVIPKGQGELKDHAQRLSNYIKQPKEEAHALRALMFAQYLGGSIASAAVNFTQPFTVTFPYLSQFGGAAKSGAALIQAMKDQREGVTLEADLATALHHAEEDGVVSPQAVHELQAQAQGRAALRSGDGTRKGDAIATAQNGLSKLALGWGKLFGLAEQVNRRSTFIAAYRVAVAHKPVLQQELASATGDQRANVQRRLAEIADPKAFAYKAVNDTQFISNKANKSRFARGPIGATLMTFKSYSTNYLELLHRLGTQSGPEGKLAMALMLAMLFLMAGASGMPGGDDLEDLADFFAQRLGYNWSSQQAKQQFLDDLFGKTMGNFIDKGITGLPGSPLDVSARMGMGNLLPGTGLLLQKRNHEGDMKELLGPVGDLIQRGFSAADQMLSGDLSKAALTVMPKAVGNAAQGISMATNGMYKDAKGYKVIDSTPGEAVLKGIGFQPATVARVQQANYTNQRAKDFYSLKSQEINARWAKGIFEKDPDEIAGARAMMARWNANNPDQVMRANMAAIVKRVKEMRKSKDQRIADTAPRALRSQMKKEVADMQADMR